jgi:hypothetical protein
MWLIVIAMLVGAVVVFTVKKPLQLDSSIKSGGQPLACPACGSFFANAAAPGAIVRCADCGAYGEVDAQRQLRALAADFVSPNHAFHSYLPEAPKWPAACCMCGQPATRTENLKITYAGEPTFEEKITAQAVVAVASMGTMKVAHHHVNVTERYKVPHCAEHAGGAKLVPAGVSFRSYSYYKQFIDANRSNVGT